MMEQTDRQQTWLSPPGPTVKLDPKEAAKARRAITLLKKAVRNRHSSTGCCSPKAYASPLIEGISQDPTAPDTYTNALHRALQDALASDDPGQVNEWHRTLLANHPDPRIRPGQYRNLGVKVGRWIPPHHSEVTRRMQRFLTWMYAEPEPLMRAIWGHRYFETIHPFADGNGRTGRLLVVQALQCPVMVSRHV